MQRRNNGTPPPSLEGRSPEIFLLNNEGIRDVTPRDVAAPRLYSASDYRKYGSTAYRAHAVETWRCHVSPYFGAHQQLPYAMATTVC
ncbi:MAG: hypothetical protein LBJ57_00410 [Prevotellaceae bacterium]|nr:hypothetical protein [Prevotellaceae bacterium]